MCVSLGGIGISINSNHWTLNIPKLQFQSNGSQTSGNYQFNKPSYRWIMELKGNFAALSHPDFWQIAKSNGLRRFYRPKLGFPIEIYGAWGKYKMIKMRSPTGGLIGWVVWPYHQRRGQLWLHSPKMKPANGVYWIQHLELLRLKHNRLTL